MMAKAVPGTVQTKTTQTLQHGVHGSTGAQSVVATGSNAASPLLVPIELITPNPVVVTMLLLTLTTAGVAAHNWVGLTGTRVKDWNSAAASEEPDRSPSTGVSDELLLPEERVVRLLETNGGQLRQQEIVEAMDRSPSTVSRYLSSLEDDRRIKRVRVSRENVVFLPDSDPAPQTGIERHDREPRDRSVAAGGDRGANADGRTTDADGQPDEEQVPTVPA